MAYEKTIWKDRLVEKPNTYRATSNLDGTVTLNREEGIITEEGTPVNAAAMNKIEIELEKANSQLGEKATFKNGSGTFPINQTTFTVTDAFVTVNTLITVIPKTEKNGTWSVVSNNGNFVITSDSIETVAVSFDWAGVK